MRSAQLVVLAIAAATAAANVLTDSVTIVTDASTAQHISIGTESVPVVSPSATQSPSLTDSESRTNVDALSTESGVASSTGVTRPASFPNATTTLASSVVPTKSQNTTTPTSHVTGGAIPQQMQSSMAGLIGFCIMGLIML
ncbi:hypothetical protein M419DRAFT_9100 [Trichoderma reesei RUT C-30]|uniref:GPI anchored protein n=1 Tax=Hypocrea jecorina (strain ATCC 56765 / BCRC 32924 / NRRL 11460 / Rut C-30) TaxID=1344414 RepID=A0A024S901_HYPJR|nr:hypothetical protein M419DRAFT_9100 [Trichoderma reesei RUT C-30]